MDETTRQELRENLPAALIAVLALGLPLVRWRLWPRALPTALEPLWLAAVTFAVLLPVFRWSAGHRWRAALLLAGGTAALSYALNATLRLPRG